MRRRGKVALEFLMAERTRSLDSLTAASGSPTMVITGTEHHRIYDSLLWLGQDRVTSRMSRTGGSMLEPRGLRVHRTPGSRHSSARAYTYHYRKQAQRRQQ